MNLSNRKRIVMGLAAFALAATFLAARAQEQRPHTRAGLMRLKLDTPRPSSKGSPWRTTRVSPRMPRL